MNFISCSFLLRIARVLFWIATTTLTENGVERKERRDQENVCFFKVLRRPKKVSENWELSWQENRNCVSFLAFKLFSWAEFYYSEMSEFQLMEAEENMGVWESMLACLNAFNIIMWISWDYSQNDFLLWLWIKLSTFQIVLTAWTSSDPLNHTRHITRERVQLKNSKITNPPVSSANNTNSWVPTN